MIGPIRCRLRFCPGWLLLLWWDDKIEYCLGDGDGGGDGDQYHEHHDDGGVANDGDGDDDYANLCCISNQAWLTQYHRAWAEYNLTISTPRLF